MGMIDKNEIRLMTYTNLSFKINYNINDIFSKK